MKLKFDKPYPPIDHFDEISLPDFVCITGQNGSGKTRLFEGIQKNHFHILNDEGVCLKNILPFDYNNFITQSPYNKNNDNNQDYKSYKITLSSSTEDIKKLQSHIKKLQLDVEGLIRDKLLKGVPENRIDNVLVFLKQNHSSNSDRFYYWLTQQADTAVISGDDKDIIIQNYDEYNREYQKIKRLVDSVMRSGTGTNIFRLQTHYMDKNHSEGFILGDRLFKHIKAYKMVADEVLLKKAKEAVRSDSKIDKAGLLNSDGSPWNAVNRILEKYDCNGYFIAEGSIKDPYIYQDKSSYKPDVKLINKKTDDSVPIDELSSGETILFALAISIYEMRSSNDKLDVLLLDEVGTNLHPSQMGKFIEAIKETFVDKGVKVMVTTHSPSTVALMPEGSVFAMRDIGDVDSQIIYPIDNESALEMLTDGFLTYSSASKIKSAEKMQVYVEGPTDEKYFQKACQLLKQDLLASIDFKTLPSTGCVALVTKYRTLKPVVEEDSVSFKSKSMFILDCDTDGDSCNAGSVIFRHKLDEIEQNPVKTGVENLFSTQTLEKVDDGMIRKQEIVEDGNTEKNWIIEDQNKVRLCDWICDNGTAEDFAHFKPVLDEIERILNLQ